jgi:hypothetical protein
LERFRAEPQDVTIRIFDVELKRPRLVVKLSADSSSAGFVFTIESGGVLHTNPGPRSRIALLAPARSCHELTESDLRVRNVFVPSWLVPPNGSALDVLARERLFCRRAIRLEY